MAQIVDSFIDNPNEVSWPTEPGHFWFYGYRYGKMDETDKKELMFVTVRPIANGVMITGSGQSFFKNEVEEARFIPASLPTLPAGVDPFTAVLY